MKASSLRLCLLPLLFFAVIFTAFAQAQTPPKGYDPLTKPVVDPEKYPYGSDRGVGEQAYDSMKKFMEYLHVGAAISNQLGWEDPQTGKFRPEFNWQQHPWKCGNPAAESDWIRDSYAFINSDGGMPGEIFRGCFRRAMYLDDPLGQRNALVFRQIIPTPWGCFRVSYYEDPPFKRGSVNPATAIPGAGDDQQDFNCCPADPEVLEICEFQKGYHAEVHWPADQVSINNFGIASFDPTYECGNERYARPNLLKDYDERLINQFMERMGYTPKDRPTYPPLLRTNPHVGQTHTAGMLPTDQTYSQEAHVYRTYLSQVAANNLPEDPLKGFTEDCHCFYQAVETRERGIVTGWSEEPLLLPYWRMEELSGKIDYANGLNRLYEYATPKIFGGRDQKGIDKYRNLEFTFPAERSCAAYRATRWPGKYDLGVIWPLNFSAYLTPRENFYGDLFTTVGVLKMPGITEGVDEWEDSFVGPKNAARMELQEMMSRQCWRGGGELMPITGKLSGFFSELPAAAVIARRAIEVMSSPSLIPPERRVRWYSDNFDKMQRIYPLNNSQDPRFAEYNDLPSACYRTYEIPNYILPQERGGYTYEGDQHWPKDLIRLEQLGEKRFAYWDRRRVCMCPQGGAVHAFKLERALSCKLPIWTTIAKSCTRVGPGCAEANDGDWGTTGVVFRTDGNDIRDVPLGIFPYPFLDNPMCPVDTSGIFRCPTSTGLCPPPGS